VEETISLSKIIKFSPLVESTKQKPVEIKRLSAFQQKESLFDSESKASSIRLNAEEEADTIIEQARQKAEKLLQETEQEVNRKLEEITRKESSFDHFIEQSRKEASEKGYQEGYEQGLQQCEKDYQNMLEEATKILSSAQALQHKKLMEAEPHLIDLSIAVAGKIIGESLAFNENWKKFVTEALNQVRQEEDIKLFVPPKHYQDSVDLADHLSKVFNTDIIVYPDGTKAENGCVIETKYGQIDASVDSQLQEMKEKLLELVGEDHERHSGSGVD
jgi:flagellar assembly protein FliH